MKAKKIIVQQLEKIVEEISGQKIPVQIIPSENSQNGEYYSNIAMRLSSTLKKKPLDIAYEIKKMFDDQVASSFKNEALGSTIKKTEVAPPGFVNFFLTEKYLAETAGYINKKGDAFGTTETLNKQKVMIEFTDPNPFKEFHIGHLYSNIVGESLCRLFESQDATVRRVCYQGDVGLHVAKAIFGMLKLKDQIPADTAPLSVRAQFMGRSYALGATTYEKDEEAKKEIHDLNKKIYDTLNDNAQGEVRDLYKKGRAWSLEYFDSIYARLGTKFTRFYFESEMAKEGVEIVHEFLKKGIFEESEGAVIFPGKKYGLHNRVFINSLGLPTYEAKDLGLAPTKYKEFAYDRSIIITAQEQAEYFKVVLAALKQINPELAEKTTHISHGMVRLPTGKMSSRTGDVITGEWLIDEAISRIRKEYPEMDDETSEMIGLSAIKYALLKSHVGGDIEFNFEESIALEGASGPYIQYTYVRTKSILDKNKKDQNGGSESSAEESPNIEELDLLRQLIYFPEVVQTAQEKLSPHHVAEYLFVLSQKFNNFYQKHKIADDTFRLGLTEAVGTTLKNGLNLLGIKTVERM